MSGPVLVDRPASTNNTPDSTFNASGQDTFNDPARDPEQQGQNQERQSQQRGLGPEENFYQTPQDEQFQRLAHVGISAPAEIIPTIRQFDPALADRIEKAREASGTGNSPKEIREMLDKRRKEVQERQREAAVRGTTVETVDKKKVEEVRTRETEKETRTGPGLSTAAQYESWAEHMEGVLLREIEFLDRNPEFRYDIIAMIDKLKDLARSKETKREKKEQQNKEALEERDIVREEVRPDSSHEGPVLVQDLQGRLVSLEEARRERETVGQAA